ncbi:outer membrane usher protein [Raoultella sp. BIGb0138]|uniref:fimbria/pilus outer membrane usher protein n=1 Tax=Raoultella sp. BIGb0138 TaxID=2485115 RepID=UPI001044A282|nr:fimbria/pilus outer membrane usher protein [Raoultella sp. BIGb0138]TCW17675.1 outer membrane usher protein [Raoultella sp. BIGb0138]
MYRYLPRYFNSSESPMCWCRLLVICPVLFSHDVWGETEFEQAFLRRGKNGVSQAVFINQDSLLPGRRLTDIVVNERFDSKAEIDFVDTGKAVIPCLSQTQLQEFGIRVALYSGWVTRDKENITPSGAEAGALARCEDLPQRIPASSLKYDNTNQTLNITVPQEAVDKQRFTMISPAEWDHGVPSLRTSYSGYFYSSRLKGASGAGGRTEDLSSSSAWLSLNTTGSLGPWRLYSMDSFNHDNDGRWTANHDRSYLARDIAALRSSLQAGEIYTRTYGTMTGSLPLRGILLATSERMSLDNQYSYAPVIRGVARTNARLSVRQRGRVIYSTLLTPGAFALEDIYTAQVGADLDVTVEESDGQIQTFRVPYTALPGMLRPGSTRYSLAAGRWRNPHGAGTEPALLFATLEHGLERVTLNSSALVAEKYQMLSLGAAWNIGAIGAFSAEVAHARYNEIWSDHRQREGAAARLLYARQFDATGTSLQLLGYQYQSASFLDPAEFLSRQSLSDIDGNAPDSAFWQRRRRNRMEATVSQNLQAVGSLYLTLSQERFYGTREKNTSLSAGTGTTVGNASVSLSLTYNRNNHISDNQLGLSISLPLSSRRPGGQDAGFLSYGLSRNRDNQYGQTLGYAGTSAGNALNYSANVQRDPRGDYSQALSLGWNASKASLTGGFSRGGDYRQYSAGITGGLTLYESGVILSPSLGNTVAIVETPGAEGIRVSGASSARTDSKGRAMVTWLTPYRYNEVTLDTSVADGAELQESSRKVVPSEGAAVRLRFATRGGRRALVAIGSKKRIPIGALVYVENEAEEAGIVGQKGLTWLTGLDTRQAQALRVKWGNTASEQCRATLPAPTNEQLKPENLHQKITLECL